MSMMRHLLWPIALIYGVIVLIRHKLFDWGICYSAKGAIKTIVLGNVALGGTGKTPHAAFILKLMGATDQAAFLSRGYGRKSPGIFRINSDATAEHVGDEPLLIARRFPQLACYVGENRLDAIAQIAGETQASFVVLDDALQHRKLQPDMALMLTTWDRPYVSDYLLPVGGLRDWSGRVQAADAVVVTKCPLHIGEVERSAMAARLGLGHIPIFFSGLHYGTPLALRSQAALQAGDEVVVVTAIADARLFVEHVRASYRVVQHLEFRDHAVFTEQEIAQWGAKKSGQHVNVLTTEKDAMRLLTLHWPTELRVFYIPIEVVLIGDGEQERLSSLIRQKLAL